MILQKITDNYLWFLMVILVVNFTQRKYYPRSAQKRIATLIIAGLAMVYQILLTIILARGWPQYLAIVAIIRHWPLPIRSDAGSSCSDAPVFPAE